MILDVKDLDFSYNGEEKILEDISFSIDEPKVIGLLGANGAGKSTLFRLLLKSLEADKGQIFINDKDINTYKAKELSRQIAYIPQSHSPVYNYSVIDVVLMGLAGKMNVFSLPKKEEEEKAMEALKMFKIDNLATRGYQNISGGQRQLVLIARALIQEAKVILMDEPVANLDFGNQELILRTIRQVADKGYTVLISMHNPIHAFSYTDSVLILNDRKLLAYGETNQVLTEDILEKIYGIDISVHEISHNGKSTKIALAK